MTSAVVTAGFEAAVVFLAAFDVLVAFDVYFVAADVAAAFFEVVEAVVCEVVEADAAEVVCAVGASVTVPAGVVLTAGGVSGVFSVFPQETRARVTQAAANRVKILFPIIVLYLPFFIMYIVIPPCCLSPKHVSGMCEALR